MARALGIRERKRFRLFVVDEKNEHSVLEEDVRIFDVIAQAQHEVSQKRYLNSKVCSCV